MTDPTRNRRVVLAARPQGAPTAATFRLESVAVPDPADGQLLIRNLFLSLDPYMRGRISDAPSYAEPVAVGGVMVGGTVGRVVKSRHGGFRQGELVSAYGGWQDYALSDGTGVTRLDPALTHPSWALGVLGMPGYTAWHGLLQIGAPRPGETVVVAAASGAVGSVVGQIAKIKGARVIGIAGGPEKCRFVREELGLDDCIDHRAPQLAERLRAACPQGIDVYFENVGGAVFDAVLPLMNVGGRIPLCGVVSHYNDTELPPGPDRTPALLLTLLRKRLKVQGFIISDHFGPELRNFLTDMSGWLAQGRIRYREDVVQGLENAPEAFIGLLAGRNFGKLIVKLAD